MRKFTPLTAPRHTDSAPITLCARDDASSLDLFDEADIRQQAAHKLVSAFAVLDNLQCLEADELYGCFLAVRLFLDDSTALYEAGRKAQQQEAERMAGGAQ